MRNLWSAVKPMGMAGVRAPASRSAMPMPQAYAFAATQANEHRRLITDGSVRPLGPSGGTSG